MIAKILISLLANFFVATVFLAEAQPPAKVPKIGWLSPSSAASSTTIDLFQREFRKLGYVEGKNVVFESRHADDKLDRLPALADELVRLKVDVIIVSGSAATVAAKKTTSTIPIVFLTVPDPVALGLVDSLARPGGNVTGFTTIAEVLAAKPTGATKGSGSQTLPRCGAMEPTESKL
jgi:putative tryptophan/tyrosine transport system substrate-binding protein